MRDFQEFWSEYGGRSLRGQSNRPVPHDGPDPSERSYGLTRAPARLYTNHAVNKESVSREETLRRRGWIVGRSFAALIVTSLTALWTYQIVVQVFGQTSSNEKAARRPAASLVDGCRPGVRQLIRSVREARHAAAAESGGEQAALQRFREVLRPTWGARSRIGQQCAGDPVATRALKQVDLLRYAEEHAVRYEVHELAERRRQVRAVEADLEPGQSSGSAAGTVESASPAH